MNSQNHKYKMLLLLDGSERALDSIRYIVSTEAFASMKVVLISIYAAVPESYLDLERTPEVPSEAQRINQWQVQQVARRKQYMQQASEILKDGGFDDVEIRIQERVRGVARDILIEAGNGYDIAVFSRRGMGQLAGLPVGSVATKLLQKMAFVPIILVSENARTGRLLVAVDGSPDAMRAVDYVGRLLGGGSKVGLIHVIRSTPDLEETDSDLLMTETCRENARKNMEAIFDKMTEQLVSNGFSRSDISGKIVTGSVSRAGTILDEASRGGYDTIVLGRKGLSRVKDFFIGRVSNKVIQAGGDFAVWMV